MVSQHSGPASEQRSTADPPTRVGDRYRLDERIGSGASGAVWRATDERLGRVVAVKLMHPWLANDSETVARFRREAVAAAVSHPHAVVVYDIGGTGGQAYLVMEHIDGPTLADAIEKNGVLAPPLVAGIGQQVASALAAAHRRGIVHRDVKPANILLDPHGNAKIGDFGIAKALGSAQAGLTEPGSVMGTAAYVAPEQLGGDEVGPATDVFSLGLVLHECLTGERPFGDGTPTAIAARRMTTELRAPSRSRPEIPASLDTAVTRAIRRDPRRRFADASEFAAALSDSAPAAPRTAIRDLATRTEGRTAAREPTAAPGAATHPGTDASPRDTTDIAVAGTTGTATSAGTHTAAPAATHTEPLARRAAGPAADPAGGADERSGPSALPDGAGTGGARGSGAGGGGARSRWMQAAAAVLLLIGAATAVRLLAADDSDPEPSPDAAAPAAVTVAAAGDYDPLGGGEEHAEEVGALHDGDPSTTWSTESYTREDLGGLKPGVGVWLDLGETRRPASVGLDLATPGIDVHVYAFDEWPPAAGPDPRAWGAPVASAVAAPPDVRLDVAAGTGGRYWLVWVTSLVPRGDGFGASIGEVTFTGR